ncbi:CmcJ/NvfI family oxidoreductase [Pseudomonas silesiensis]|uniref:CmcJ/NvfI family oxidoreductase n=1 Tax=Pseudomonas silesiensis TaxID=1853130 RepID=UPI0034D64454
MNIPASITSFHADSLPFVETQVNYAGTIEGRALFDAVDQANTNVAFLPATVRMHDVRDACDRFNLDNNGFAFVRHTSSVADLPEIREQNLTLQSAKNALNDIYQNEVGAFLLELTGAREILVQINGMLVRTSKRAKRQSWAPPAAFVHMDFTENSAHKFLNWSLDAAGQTVKPYSRFMILQTWRAISPGPQDSTLAICDGRTATTTDAVVMDSVIGPKELPGSFFESRLCVANPSHRWYFLSNMEADDLLVFKGFDSATPNSMNAMHTAFENTLLGENGIPRVSIEARFFAFFD